MCKVTTYSWHEQIFQKLFCNTNDTCRYLTKITGCSNCYLAVWFIFSVSFFKTALVRYSIVAAKSVYRPPSFSPIPTVPVLQRLNNELFTPRTLPKCGNISDNHSYPIVPRSIPADFLSLFHEKHLPLRPEKSNGKWLMVNGKWPMIND